MLNNIDIHSYDKVIIAFSGGKDCTACFLYLLDLGLPKEKIELWHHDIDGKGGLFMDWEITHDYCTKFAQSFGVPIYFSWKEGGFKREMLRDGDYTAPICFETETKEIKKVGGISGKKGKRLKFPQVSPDLRVRWCSAYLKIDVCASAIRNQDRFNGIRTLVVSGERGEESPARAKYEIFEPDRADLRNGKHFKRHVDRLRPIRDWKENKVWEIIEKHKVRVHPAYYLGFGRVSCKYCIFGSANQFKTAYTISKEQGDSLIDYEKKFGCTMKRNTDLKSLIEKGSAYDNMDEETIQLATNKTYTESIFMDIWKQPNGAYGESCGSM